jgi:hypothetical protein
LLSVCKVKRFCSDPPLSTCRTLFPWEIYNFCCILKEITQKFLKSPRWQQINGPTTMQSTWARYSHSIEPFCWYMVCFKQLYNVSFTAIIFVAISSVCSKWIRALLMKPVATVLLMVHSDCLKYLGISHRKTLKNSQIRLDISLGIEKKNVSVVTIPNDFYIRLDYFSLILWLFCFIDK